MNDLSILGVSALGRCARLRGEAASGERDASRLFVRVALALFVVLTLAGAALMIACTRVPGSGDMVAAGHVIG